MDRRSWTPFTEREDVDILIYAMVRMGTRTPGGNELWKQAVEDGVCQTPGRGEKARTYQAIKERLRCNDKAIKYIK
jgi:hypothetical protein